MTDLESEAAEPKSDRDRYMSTTYSHNVTCGICGLPLKNVPAMYESIDIDWRCGKCLRRDKPVLEDHVG